MKILVVDDQPIILLALKKCLTNQGYDVVTAMNVENGIKEYENTKPDFVIVDINMPANDNDKLINNHTQVSDVSGLDIVNHIKIIKKDSTPVMVLSGNNDENIIAKGYELGVLDYLMKPISFNEIALKVNKFLKKECATTLESKSTLIQNAVVGIVIPLTNKKNNNFLNEKIKNFISANSGYHLCFISKNEKITELNELMNEYEGRISILKYNMKDGNAEAIRLGVLHLAKQQQFDYIGFLDYKLSTKLEDFHSLVTTIKNSEYKLVSGAKNASLNSNIEKELPKSLFSNSINFIVKKTLGINLNDVYCSAKIMDKEVIENTFNKKFLTKSMFYIEILMRMRKIYGTDKTEKYISEKTLNKWNFKEKYYMNIKDSFNSIAQIGKIALLYR
jgi:DNA-binding response OmpR family regulator